MHGHLDVRRRGGRAQDDGRDGARDRASGDQRRLLADRGLHRAEREKARLHLETARDDHEKKKAYLREAGYDIIADKAVGLKSSEEYYSMPPKLWYDTALSLRRDDADVYFLSCANIRATDVIEDIERAVGKPVVTSNQAAFWHAMRTIGLKDSPPGLGRLVREH